MDQDHVVKAAGVTQASIDQAHPGTSIQGLGLVLKLMGLGFVAKLKQPGRTQGPGAHAGREVAQHDPAGDGDPAREGVQLVVLHLGQHVDVLVPQRHNAQSGCRTHSHTHARSQPQDAAQRTEHCCR